MAAAALAQTPGAPVKAAAESSPKAPPEVDAALRARISEFYQFEVDGKFSKALQLVAEDTKDMFIGSSKPAYRSFEILSIKYAPEFTTAQVSVLVGRLMPIEGFMGHPLQTKLLSRWKVENGLWCWYVDPMTDLPQMPFAPSAPAGMPGQQQLPGTAPVKPPAAVPIPAHIGVITVDKSNVALKSSGPSSEQVLINNPAPWPVLLSLKDPRISGVTVKLDRFTVKPAEKAILSIQSDGGQDTPKKPFTVMVTVVKTNQLIPIKVTFVN